MHADSMIPFSRRCGAGKASEQVTDFVLRTADLGPEVVTA